MVSMLKMEKCLYVLYQSYHWGNSGSPAIDANGNLGLNFDRVWEGTMSDIYYDPSICKYHGRHTLRTFLLWINTLVQKNLISELKLVHQRKVNN
jgi:hypothetical protein